MNYRSISDLNRDIRRWAMTLDRTPDLVAGIPRSGLLAANLLALHLNRPLADIDSLCEGRALASGQRLDGGNPFERDEPLDVLIVDDSLLTGHQMRRVRDRLAAAGLPHRLTYGAVYVAPGQEHAVDRWFDILETPRCFEWNVLHRDLLDQWCLAFEGVLCRRPHAAETEDNTVYRRYLEEAAPLYLPTRRIGWVVACRPERFRAETEDWLARRHVDFRHLVMMDTPDARACSDPRVQVAHKARAYRQSDARLFIEGSHEQAAWIARRVGHSVLCTEHWDMVPPSPAAQARNILVRYAVNLFRRPYETLARAKRNVTGRIGQRRRAIRARRRRARDSVMTKRRERRNRKLSGPDKP